MQWQRDGEKHAKEDIQKFTRQVVGQVGTEKIQWQSGGVET